MILLFSVVVVVVFLQYFHSLFVILLFRFDAIEIELTLCLTHDIAMFFSILKTNTSDRERAEEENTANDNCRQTIVSDGEKKSERERERPRECNDNKRLC